MAYDRWGMTPAAASALTGVAGLTDADLEAAEDELVDVMGWAPTPTSYSTTLNDRGRPTDVRVYALGRAVAWQAAHRNAKPAKPDDEAVRLSSEQIGGGDYSASYAGGGKRDGGRLAARALELLAGNGWLARRAGHTRP